MGLTVDVGVGVSNGVGVAVELGHHSAGVGVLCRVAHGNWELNPNKVAFVSL